MDAVRQGPAVEREYAEHCPDAVVARRGKEARQVTTRGPTGRASDRRSVDDYPHRSAACRVGAAAGRRLSFRRQHPAEVIDDTADDFPLPRRIDRAERKGRSVVGAGNRLGAEQGRMPVAIVCVGIERERALPEVRKE